MKAVPLAFAAAMIATAAVAQTTTTTTPGQPSATPGTALAPAAGVGAGTGAGAMMSPNATTVPGTSMGTPPAMTRPGTETPSSNGVVNRNTGAAAAGGNNNQAVATTSANAPKPAHGANSFSRGEARGRIADHGYQKVSGLKKDSHGVWRGMGMKDGHQVHVWLDYKGNVGQQ